MSSAELDFSRFEVLTFDCFGTLIDWESGILDAFRPVLAERGVAPSDDELLELYAGHEAALEAGDYLSYREVLAGSFVLVCADLGFAPTDGDATRFAAAIADWPVFPDTVAALRRLHERFRLGVITNCDRDLFTLSNRRLGVTFDCVITAEQAGAYKPSHVPFELAFASIDVPRDRILHVAQSLYHDHVPAKALDLTTVWVNRRHDRPGSGATPEASAAPDLTVPDMKTLADVALGGE